MTEGLPLYRSEDARAIDRAATERHGVPAYALMTRAGTAAWHLLRERWPHPRRIGVVCGPGNNGGDGYVVARLARKAAREVVLLTPADGAPRSEAAKQAWETWRAVGGRSEAFAGALPEVDLWVDALYGIGLSRAPQGDAAALIEAMNASGAPIVALDVPSGVDADSGCTPGVAVRAALTLQFIVAKRGLFTGAARDCAGELLLDALEVPDEILGGFAPAAALLRGDALAARLRPRRRDAHKGDHGHVLCVGGDRGTGGAILLCAEAALRAGAGLVSVATRAEHVPAVLASRPELMVRGVEDSAGFAGMLERADVVAVGPGLGQDEWGRALFAAALAAGKPLVLDADALNLLAASERPVRDAVLTPHPGEAARLLECTTREVQADRYAAAQALAERNAATVVLKGAGTIVAAPDAAPRVIGAGNPGMAVGGMGDVLTGVVAALRAQRMEAFEAATTGALLHAVAGDAAMREGGERGLLPSDLMPHLRRLANPSDMPG